MATVSERARELLCAIVLVSPKTWESEAAELIEQALLAERRLAMGGLLDNLLELDAAMAENDFMFCCGEHQHEKNCWLAELLATPRGGE